MTTNPPTSPTVEKCDVPKIEITSSSSFEEMLKLPDGKVVIVDVAKIKKAVQEAKAEERERIMELVGSLMIKPRKFEYSNYKGLNEADYHHNRVIKLVLSTLNTKEEK